MSPTDAGTTRPTASPDSSHPAARARDLRRSYGVGSAQVHALRGVDLDLPSGRFTAVMGPSGSGKSTLMHCLAGLDRPTSGGVAVGGHALQQMGDAALTRFRRDRIGFVFQAFNLLPALSAEQNIRLPHDLGGTRPDPSRFDAVIDVLGLRDRLSHRPGELSGGQQQRVAIARALVGEPAIVFADEPTGNLDSTSSAEVLGFLRRSVRELGRTVVMVTHELEAAAYADDVVVLADGRVRDHLVSPDRERLLATLAPRPTVASSLSRSAR